MFRGVAKKQTKQTIGIKIEWLDDSANKRGVSEKMKWIHSKKSVRLLLTILLCLILSNCLIIFMTKWLDFRIDEFQNRGDMEQAVMFLDDLREAVDKIATQFTVVTLGLMLFAVIFLMIQSTRTAEILEEVDYNAKDEDELDEDDIIDIPEAPVDSDLLKSSLLKAALLKPPQIEMDGNEAGAELEEPVLAESKPITEILDQEEMAEENAVARDYLSSRPELAGYEESGTLAHSYTKMVEALQKIADLEKQHSEELASANSQLHKEIWERKRAEAEIRRLSNRLISSIEDARKDLAQDLHDEFGQTLTALHLGLEGLWNSIPENLEDQKKRIDGLVILVEQLGDKIRSISSDLRPDLLDDLGLVPTLDWYISEFTEQRNDIRIDFQAVGLRKRLSSDIELVLYRIFQESLNNIVRHSKAQNAFVTLTYSHPKVIMTVKDDGVGFDTAQSSDGIGLLGMRERIVSVKGSIDIHSGVGKGVTIRVEIPVSQGGNA